MKFTFHVEPDDGEPFTVVAKTRDIAAWEAAKAGRSVGQLMDANVRMTELYALAHTAAKRQDLYAGSLAEFLAGVDLENSAEVEESDPTSPAP